VHGETLEFNIIHSVHFSCSQLPTTTYEHNTILSHPSTCHIYYNDKSTLSRRL